MVSVPKKLNSEDNGCVYKYPGNDFSIDTDESVLPSSVDADMIIVSLLNSELPLYPCCYLPCFPASLVVSLVPRLALAV